MPDTQRSLTALQSLLANNTSRQISAQDVRDFLVSAFGGYGAIRVVDGSTPQSVTDSTPVPLTGFTTNGLASGVTPDYAAGTLTVGVAGIYEIHLTTSFSGSPNVTFVVGFAVNGTPNEYRAERKISGGGDIGTAAVTALLELEAGDVVTACVSQTGSGADSITLKHAALMLTRNG